MRALSRPFLIALSTLTVACAGCVFVPIGELPEFDTAEIASGTATLRLIMKIKPAGTGQKGSTVPYDIFDVKHVVFGVYKLTGKTESIVVDTIDRIGKPIIRDLDWSVLGMGIDVPNLAHTTTYRIRAKAYREAGDADVNLISVASESFADIQVGTEAAPILVTVPVILGDREAPPVSAPIPEGGGVSPIGESVE